MPLETKYTPPTPPPLPSDYDEFIKSRTEREKQLLELARKKLGSSFIVQWCHMYKKWSSDPSRNSAPSSA